MPAPAAWQRLCFPVALPALSKQQRNEASHQPGDVECSTCRDAVRRRAMRSSRPSRPTARHGDDKAGIR